MPKILENARSIDLLVCMRTNIMPNPPAPSTRSECSDCGIAIWLADTSPREPKRVCNVCAVEYMDKVDDIAITRKQLDWFKRRRQQ